MAKESAYTDTQIAEQLKALPGWRHEGGALRRTYKTDGWPTTLMLVNAVGFYAEAADHHPDLEVHWGSVKDVALAKQVEQTALWQAEPPFRPAEKFVRKG